MARRNQHILVIPYPAQGHVIPLMQLSQRLVKEGFRITFVNTDFNQERIVNSVPTNLVADDGIRLVSVPDGLDAGEDRSHLENLHHALSTVMTIKLKELAQEINESDGGILTCVIADIGMGWAFEAAQEMGIQRVGFWPASASILASNCSIQKFLDDGVIDKDGTPINQESNRFSALTPAMESKNLVWTHIDDAGTQRIWFEIASHYKQVVESLDWVICNSAYDLEPGAFALAPNIHPIGPLSINYQSENVATNFWPEDAACLKWLDQQPPRSVILAAFGSFTIFQQNQFRELALGLELSNKPFLWVVRPDMITVGKQDSFPEGFRERIAGRAQLVGWAPQLKVLGHGSIACFLSHCGWNSTLEGVSNGVPFLCWPYFADQFTNESYICDVWKTGLRLEKDQSGLISKEEIKRKVDLLVGDEGFKERAHELKQVPHNSVKDGGQSQKNFQTFTKWLRH